MNQYATRVTGKMMVDITSINKNERHTVRLY
jgi:hypothetical protein